VKAFVNVLSNKGFRFIGTNRVGTYAFFVATDASYLIPFSSDPNNYCYVDWRVRESRGRSSQLSYSSGEERISEFQNLPLADLSTREITK